MGIGAYTLHRLLKLRLHLGFDKEVGQRSSSYITAVERVLLEASQGNTEPRDSACL